MPPIQTGRLAPLFLGQLKVPSNVVVVRGSQFASRFKPYLSLGFSLTAQEYRYMLHHRCRSKPTSTVWCLMSNAQTHTIVVVFKSHLNLLQFSGSCRICHRKTKQAHNFDSLWWFSGSVKVISRHGKKMCLLIILEQLRWLRSF